MPATDIPIKIRKILAVQFWSKPLFTTYENLPEPDVSYWGIDISWFKTANLDPDKKDLKLNG